MKATIAIVICLLGLTVAFVSARDTPSNPKLRDQFTCTKCNYTVEDWWYGKANSIGKYWENGPDRQFRRDYLFGSDQKPFTVITNKYNPTHTFGCEIRNGNCSCRSRAWPDVFTMMNEGEQTSFQNYETVRGIYCEVWVIQWPRTQFKMWMTPKYASGFNTPVRLREAYGSISTIDFLEMTYGPPDPSLFEEPKKCVHIRPK